MMVGANGAKTCAHGFARIGPTQAGLCLFLRGMSNKKLYTVYTLQIYCTLLDCSFVWNLLRSIHQRETQRSGLSAAAAPGRPPHPRL